MSHAVSPFYRSMLAPWTLPVPAFAYRFGTEGALTATVRSGLTAIGYSRVSGTLGTLDAGVGVRAWLSPAFSLLSNASADWSFGTDDERLLFVHTSVGLSWDVTERVALSLGAGWSGAAELDERRVRVEGELVTLDTELPSSLVLGAVQTLGYRSLPLVQIHVTEWLSLDAYASWGIELGSGDVRDRYLGGFSWTF